LKHSTVCWLQGVLESPPARGRGLKPTMDRALRIELLSPPARGRGLKPVAILEVAVMDGRPPRGGAD